MTSDHDDLPGHQCKHRRGWQGSLPNFAKVKLILVVVIDAKFGQVLKIPGTEEDRLRLQLRLG